LWFQITPSRLSKILQGIEVSIGHKGGIASTWQGRLGGMLDSSDNILGSKWSGENGGRIGVAV